MEDKISRWVAFLIAPLVAILAGFIANIAQDAFGYDLDPTEVAIYVTGVAIGAFHVAATWVRNRGRWEIAELLGINPETLDRGARSVVDELPDAPHTPGGTTYRE